MEISKIIVIADPLRHRLGQDGNADMFFGLLHGILNRTCDLPVELLKPNELINLQKEVYSAYNLYFDPLKVESSIFGGVPVDCWMQICFAEPNSKMLELTQKYFKDSLVICREPSYIIKKSLLALNIPFVEMAIHSVRYLDDLVIGFTSNIDTIYEKLKAYEVNKELFYFHADLLKAEAYRKWSYFYNPINKPTAIFFAQTAVDRSLLDFKNKRLISFMDYSDNFYQLTKDYEEVYYKPHPHYKDENIIKYLKQFKNVKIFTDNISTYDLLSFPNIKKCVAISSGTINEAKYFGKITESYLGQPYHYSDEVEDKQSLDKNIHYISIHKEYLTSKFWSDILSPIIETNSIYSINTDLVSNKMRRIIGSSWGYEDNDSCQINSLISSINNKIEKNNTSIQNNIFKITSDISSITNHKAAEAINKNPYTVYLLGFIRIMKKKKKNSSDKYSFLWNLVELSKSTKKIKMKILGIPFVTIKRQNSTKHPTKVIIKKKCDTLVEAIKTAIINSKQNHTQKIRTILQQIKEYKIINTELLIVDNFEPSFLKSGFRVIEFNHFLRKVKNSYLLTFSDNIYKYSDWKQRDNPQEIVWSKPKNYEDYYKNRQEYIEYFPDLNGKLRYMVNTKYNAKGAYVMFLYNAYLAHKFLEKHKIPFAFTLFPGGGFCLNQPFSDHMLKSVCESPMLRGIYCPQKIVYDYLINKGYISKDKLFYRYGGGFFQISQSDVKEKKYYKQQKQTFDIAFIAYRYMPKGIDKGFDLFLEVANIINQKYPFVHFHNVGTNGLFDYPNQYSNLKNNLHHYGSQKSSFFPEFYSKIDIILSPNRSNVLRPGAFDGFPMVVEGSFCGSALFISNPENAQTEYVDRKHLVIIKNDVQDIVTKIEYYLNNLDKLYKISKTGQILTQKIFDINKQKKDRNEFIQKYLNIKVN